LVEALRYKQEGREFGSRLSHWDYSLASNYPPQYGIEVDSACNTNEYQGIRRPVGRADNFTTYMCLLSRKVGSLNLLDH
jgi:hypothetical protein